MNGLRRGVRPRRAARSERGIAGAFAQLLKIVESAGLDAKLARDMLETRSFRAAIDADWRRSGEFGITGVPTFVVGGYGLVGAQPYEALAKLVTVARQEPREMEPAQE